MSHTSLTPSQAISLLSKEIARLTQENRKLATLLAIREIPMEPGITLSQFPDIGTVLISRKENGEIDTVLPMPLYPEQSA
jgi:hypothetical protein